MNQEQAFGELRAMLEQIPSISGFKTLMLFLDHHAKLDKSGLVRERWLSYTAQKLDRSWPDQMRECPKPLLAAYESGQPLWCDLIRSLSFEYERLNQTRVKALIATTHMHAVTHLNLRSCYIRWPDLAELAEHSPFGALKGFDLYKSTKLPNSAHPFLIRFFQSPMLAELESLSFRNWSSLKAADYELVAEHFPLNKLKTLYMDKVSPRRFKSLLKTGKLNQLEELTVAGSSMLKTLSAHKELAHLKRLTVFTCSGKDIEAFSKASHFQELQELTLYDVELTENAFAKAMTLQSLPHLTKLALALAPSVDDLGHDLQKNMIAELGAQLPADQLDALSISFWDGLPPLSLLLNASTHKTLSNLSAFSWGSQQGGTPDGYHDYIQHTAETLAAFPFARLRSLQLRFESPRADKCSGTLASLERCAWLEQLESLKLYGRCLDEDCFKLLSTTQDRLALRVFGGHVDWEQWQWQRLLTCANVSRLEFIESSVFEPKEMEAFATELLENPELFPSLRGVILPRVFQQLYVMGTLREWSNVIAADPRWISLGQEPIRL